MDSLENTGYRRGYIYYLGRCGKKGYVGGLCLGHSNGYNRAQQWALRTIEGDETIGTIGTIGTGDNGPGHVIGITGQVIRRVNGTMKEKGK